MCGIVGYVGPPAATEAVLVEGLRRVEYRGYDAAGVAVTGRTDRPAGGAAHDVGAPARDGAPVRVCKRAGDVSELVDALGAADAPSLSGPVGIGHTRWSTHGDPTRRNAHPHCDDRRRVAVVHNGVLDNHRKVRRALETEGVAFTSETDTEVIPHLIAARLADGDAPAAAFRAAIDRIEGQYAVVAAIGGVEAAFAARSGSPLVVGPAPDRPAAYLASDPVAFLDRTREVARLPDGATAVVRPDDLQVRVDGEPVSPPTRRVDRAVAPAADRDGETFATRREIDDQPVALRRALEDRLIESDSDTDSDSDPSPGPEPEPDPDSDADRSTAHGDPAPPRLDLSVGPLDGIGGGRRGGVGAGTGANADGPTPAADPGATDADTDVDADVDAATDASVDPGATTTTTTTATATATATADRTPAPEGPSRVQFVGCGTSYHAALYGSYALRTAGVPATAHLAHEYAVAPPPAADALVVGVTQSGETADTLAALRTARDRGARTVAVTNAPASTVARECDEALSCRAGREVGVAATKTFTAQLVTVALLADRIRATADGGTAGRPAASRGLASASFREALTALPAQVATVIDESRAAGVAPRLAEADASFFLGRGLDRPIALEGALKLSELTYAHAEGLAAGELKHGPLARVDETTPVVAVLTGDGDPARRTADNVREVLARGAPVVLLTDGAVDAPDATATLEVPATHRLAAPVLTAVQCQLLAFHAAVHLGRDVDRPRHLAKSVTVE